MKNPVSDNVDGVKQIWAVPLVHSKKNAISLSLPIRLLLALWLSLNLRRVPNPQLHLQLRQQPLEPATQAGGFHAHSHFLTCDPLILNLPSPSLPLVTLLTDPCDMSG